MSLHDLQLKWAVPEEVGGTDVGALSYRLYCKPPPTEQDASAQTDAEVRSSRIIRVVDHNAQSARLIRVSDLRRGWQALSCLLLPAYGVCACCDLLTLPAWGWGCRALLWCTVARSAAPRCPSCCLACGTPSSCR